MSAGPPRSFLVASPTLIVLLATSCWSLPEERARLDERVGVADAGGVAVRVVDGLAAIRAIQPGNLLLWAQSPVLRLEVSASATAVEDWTITVMNILADSDLRGFDAEGIPLQVTLIRSDSCVTRRSWTVRLPSGRQATLEVSSPDALLPNPFRFGVVNDPHGRDGVRAFIQALDADPLLRFVISSGDITPLNGEASIMLEVQKALCDLRVPFYATAGNTDTGDGGVSYAWHDVFGRHSFHFTFRGVDFSFVDSASASVAPQVYDWIDGWIAFAGEHPHVFVSHVPPLDPLGSRGAGFRSRNEAAKLLSRLANGGVDLIVCGHLHNFHDLEEAGIPTVITGGDDVHYVLVDVEPETGALSVSRVRVPRD